MALDTQSVGEGIQSQLNNFKQIIQDLIKMLLRNTIFRWLHKLQDAIENRIEKAIANQYDRKIRNVEKAVEKDGNTKETEFTQEMDYSEAAEWNRQANAFGLVHGVKIINGDLDLHTRQAIDKYFELGQKRNSLKDQIDRLEKEDPDRSKLEEEYDSVNNKVKIRETLLKNGTSVDKLYSEYQKAFETLGKPNELSGISSKRDFINHIKENNGTLYCKEADKFLSKEKQKEIFDKCKGTPVRFKGFYNLGRSDLANTVMQKVQEWKIRENKEEIYSRTKSDKEFEFFKDAKENEYSKTTSNEFKENYKNDEKDNKGWSCFQFKNQEKAKDFCEDLKKDSDMKDKYVAEVDSKGNVNVFCRNNDLQKMNYAKSAYKNATVYKNCSPETINKADQTNNINVNMSAATYEAQRESFSDMDNCSFEYDKSTNTVNANFYSQNSQEQFEKTYHKNKTKSAVNETQRQNEREKKNNDRMYTQVVATATVAYTVQQLKNTNTTKEFTDKYDELKSVKGDDLSETEYNNFRDAYFSDDYYEESVENNVELNEFVSEFKNQYFAGSDDETNSNVTIDIEKEDVNIETSHEDVEIGGD